MSTYRVKRGKHQFVKTTFPWLPQLPCPILLRRKWSREWTFKFTEDSTYNMLPDKDQWDWNKLCGIAFSIPPNKNNVMVGWRWNPNTNKIEVVPYWNYDYSIIVGTPVPIKLNTEVKIRIEKTFLDTYSIYINGNKSISVQTKKNYLFAYTTSLWFGGANNSEGPYGGVAPKDLEINVIT